MVRYLDEEDTEVRRQAAITCVHVLESQAERAAADAAAAVAARAAAAAGTQQQQPVRLRDPYRCLPSASASTRDNWQLH